MVCSCSYCCCYSACFEELEEALQSWHVQRLADSQQHLQLLLLLLVLLFQTKMAGLESGRPELCAVSERPAQLAGCVKAVRRQRPAASLPAQMVTQPLTGS